MGLVKLIKNRISTEWKDAFNNNVDYLEKQAEENLERHNTTNARIDNLVLEASGDSSAEVVDARVNNKDVTFATLEERLLEHENNSDISIAALEDGQSDQSEQIDKLNDTISELYDTSGSTVDIYVALNGSDGLGDGSEEKPFKTIQKAVDQIPLLNSSNTTIWIGDGSYLEDVVVQGVNASRVVIRTIQATETLTPETGLPVKVRSVGFFYCSGYLQIRGIELVDQANTPMFESRRYGFCCEQGGYLVLYNVRCAESTKSINPYVATYIGGMSKLHVYSSYFENQAQINVSRLFGESRISSSVTGTANAIGFEADNGTVRDSTTSSLSATTKHKVSGEGLIIAGGTILNG